MKPRIEFCVTVITVCAMLLAFNYPAEASTLWSNKQTTGYAMGNTGYGAHTFVRGDVATHAQGYCGDPAGNWARGTQLSMTSGIAIPGYSTFDPNYDIFWTFYKWDTGDFGCVKATYWLDIYFYRYKRNADACSCPGVTTPTNSCVNGAITNSCNSAASYGTPLKSYYGPP